MEQHQTNMRVSRAKDIKSVNATPRDSSNSRHGTAGEKTRQPTEIMRRIKPRSGRKERRQQSVRGWDIYMKYNIY